MIAASCQYRSHSRPEGIESCDCEALLGAVTSHTRAATTRGLDYCAECSGAIGEWVPWATHSTVASCHCGEPIAYGFDGDPTHHRDMCEHCDAVRCDAHPDVSCSERVAVEESSPGISALTELVLLTDEIPGVAVETPGGEVWLHTTHQVTDWLREHIAHVRNGERWA